MKTIICILFCIIHLSVFSQSNSVYNGLNTFLGSDFFATLEEVRDNVEDKVVQIKLKEHQYDDEDMEILMDSYNASAKYYNRILLGLKHDLLNKKKRREMIKFPNGYIADLQNKLERANEYYANTFEEEYFNITGNTGAIPVQLITDIIKYAKISIELIKAVKAEVKKFNEDMMAKHLIEPYSFKPWDEIN